VRPRLAYEQSQVREERNIALIKEYIIPLASFILLPILVSMFALIWRRQPLTLIDRFLLLLVLGAFSTELYFFFTVTSQLIYLGDIDVVASGYKATKQKYIF